jgi:glutaredoxin 3
MPVVEVYSKSYCPFCVRAKALLEQKSVAYQEIKIDENPALRPQMIKRSNGSTTVPQIFINDKHVGGCDELYALHYEGLLDPLLVPSC